MFILLALFLMILTGGGFLLSLGVMLRAAFVWKTSLTARISLLIVLVGYALYFGGGLLMKFALVDHEGSESILTGLVLVVTVSSPALCWLAAGLSGADWLNVKLTDYFRASVDPPNAWPPTKQKRDER